MTITTADVPAKRTLREIMLDLQMTEDHDPRFFRLVEEQKAKVDATCWYLDRLEAEIEKIQSEWIDLLVAKKAKLQRAREKRLSYVKGLMEQTGISVLKGDVRTINLIQSPPAMTFLEEPSPEAWERYSGYVDVIPPGKPRYVWSKDAVMAAHKQGTNLPFVTVTRGSHVRYKAPKKKG